MKKAQRPVVSHHATNIIGDLQREEGEKEYMK